MSGHVFILFRSPHSVKAGVENGNSTFFASSPETEPWVEVPTQTNTILECQCFPATYIPGNFENTLCPSPTQGKNLFRQHQGGSEAVLSEVAFFLLTDIPQMKDPLLGSLGLGDKEQFCRLEGRSKSLLRK